jgi:lipopolysaccharide transport system ATP-binding protein
LNDIAIRVEDLGKRYLIGHETERERYVALRDVIARSARNVWRKTTDMARGRDIVAGDTIEEFWALKSVNLEVKRGEVLGIIGRNGAGKSTLLKILSRITEPSEGRVTINGRVASLLEVGTGFHPELTGRENIYLNGAILGMTRPEIKRKFDEIVTFAEIAKFLDTPVKRYSSGMYVRLAFAVAAHLEPEILIVDEVLAVGDAEFQEKCLGKMSSIAKAGERSVLFVSHNLVAVQSLCKSAVLLEAGRCISHGATTDVVRNYLHLGVQQNTSETSGVIFGNENVEVERVVTAVPLSAPDSHFSIASAIEIRCDYKILAESVKLHITYHIVGEQGVVAFSTFADDIEHKRGRYHSVCTIPGDLLNEGTHSIDLLLVASGTIVVCTLSSVHRFRVVDDRPRAAGWMGREPGVVRPQLSWRTTAIPSDDIA